MTEQEKQLLIKALCGLLPYKAKVEIDGYYTHTLEGIDFNTHCTISTNRGINYPLRLIKPYLRPLESMTEDEKIELKEYLDAEEVDCNGFGYIEGGTLEDYVSRIPYSLCNYVINWLISKHFDCHGLIPMGLALHAPEGMYK